MSQINLVHSVGGVAGLVMGSQREQDKFSDSGTLAGVGIGITVGVIVIAIVLIVLISKLVYWMFPDYKVLHVLFTLFLGFFWLIPAMLYYLFVLKGYHMSGLKIVKRL
jgi:hypothetical protein